MSDDYDMDLENPECEICGGEIVLEDGLAEDDIVYCEECEAEYVVSSLDPLVLTPLDEDDFDEDSEEGIDEFYDEDYD